MSDTKPEPKTYKKGDPEPACDCSDWGMLDHLSDCAIKRWERAQQPEPSAKTPTPELSKEWCRKVIRHNRPDIAAHQIAQVIERQLAAAQAEVERLREANAILQSQVDNSDANIEQMRMIWKPRALKAEAANATLTAELAAAREVFIEIRDMPNYDQDDIHRLRHKAKQAVAAIDAARAAKGAA